MKTRKSGGSLRQYLIAAAILIAGMAVSALILFRPFGTETGDAAAGSHHVRFFDAEGALLETRTVPDGQAAVPPAADVPGSRFTGWSEELFFVTADLDVHPRYEKLGTQRNIVYADAVYAGTGGRICVLPRIAGAVDCSDFIIELAYDGELLTFDGAEPALEGLTVENDAEAGVLRLAYASPSPLSQPADLARLYFRCTRDGAFSTRLPMATIEIYTVENGVKKYTDSTAYNADVYLMKEQKE